ncbi:hypothetical protein [Actinomadura formosensis]|uniref:hypothetical protein n=1 Tax=Actinomadura formosensis TaxID=60706 RepID=UPI000AA358FF|nr:hypothetical protein [Actinomadura formosensis]
MLVVLITVGAAVMIGGAVFFILLKRGKKGARPVPSPGGREVRRVVGRTCLRKVPAFPPSVLDLSLFAVAFPLCGRPFSLFASTTTERVIMKKLLLIPVTAAALALSLSACGSDSKDGGSASGATASATQPGGGTITGNGGQTTNGGGKITPAQREALTKTRECMIKKGYDMPEVDPANPVMMPKNKNGKSDAQVNKDAAECAAQSLPS